MEGEKVSSTRFRWKINNFSKVCSKKLTGVFSKKKVTTNSFEIGGQTWRLIIYPKGIKKGKYLSIYLESTLPPAGLARNVKFFLSVINQTDSAKTVKREASHEFTASSRASGIPEMLSLDELKRAYEGFIVNDTIIVEVNIPEGTRFAECRTLSDFQNLLKEKTCEKDASSTSQGCLPSSDEINHAKEVLTESLPFKFADVIERERKIELKKAFSTLSRVPDREKEAMSRLTKFFVEFDQTCEEYAAARIDIEVAKEKEKSVGLCTMMLKQLADVMEPWVELGLEIEREIAEYERILQEKNSRHAGIMEFLGSVSVPVHRSKLRLDEADSNLKLFKTKKEEPQKSFWESLKSLFC